MGNTDNLNDSNFLNTRSEVVAWLEKHYVRGYTINENLSVDVNQSVSIQALQIEFLPVKFGQVYGSFDISENKLTNLHGCPYWVENLFICSHNKLTSLAGSPGIVGSSFNCNDNRLTSLIGGPKSVEYNYSCSNNMLTSLEGAPKGKVGDFICSYNKLKNLKYIPEHIIGMLNANHNDLEEMDYLPESVAVDIRLGHNPKIPMFENLTRLHEVVIMREKLLLERGLIDVDNLRNIKNIGPEIEKGIYKI